MCCEISHTGPLHTRPYVCMCVETCQNSMCSQHMDARASHRVLWHEQLCQSIFAIFLALWQEGQHNRFVNSTGLYGADPCISKLSLWQSGTNEHTSAVLPGHAAKVPCDT